jgi:hypothetical protein
MRDTAEVHHGKMVSLYLKNRLPVPRWAEGRVIPRSGSAVTLFSVFIPQSQRLEFSNVAASDKFWWPAVNGIVYSFRHRADAEELVARNTVQ